MLRGAHSGHGAALGVGGTVGLGGAGALRVGGRVIAFVAHARLVVEERALHAAHTTDRVHRADGGAQREACKGVDVLVGHLGGGVREGRSHGLVDGGECGGRVGAVLQLDDHIHDGRGVVLDRGRGILVEEGLAVRRGQRVVDITHRKLGSGLARRSRIGG